MSITHQNKSNFMISPNKISRLDPNLLQIETPFYIYHLERLRSRIAEIRSIFDVPEFHLLFATMANDRPEVLQEIAKAAVGACVNSTLHLELSLAMGFLPEMIQFTSTGLPAKDMHLLIERGISVNLDSPLQVEQWCRLAKGSSKVGLRVNAASLERKQQGDRIGIDIADLSAAMREASSHKSVVNGLHVYVGTNFQSADEMLPTLRAFFDLASSIPELEYVNIGGGVGVDYQHTGQEFDLFKFGSEVSLLTRSLSEFLGHSITLFFEPGRSLVASSGDFFTRVTDIKRLNGITYVTVDASIAIFPRPFHHPDSLHRVQIVGKDDITKESKEVIVVGRTTFSRDILTRCILPNTLEIGDLLIFNDAGAYCQSMISRFLGQKEPIHLVLN